MTTQDLTAAAPQLTRELAGSATDPRFYALLSILPNPDPILRKLGISERVHDTIEADAHVMGDLRLIRGDLLRFEHRLVAGGAGRKEKRALELCQQLLDRAPAPNTTWNDVIWSLGRAPFRGYSVMEVVWEKSGDVLMPARLLTRPNRRFAFNADGELRLLTRDEPMNGVPTEPLYFLLNRHMADYDNPYGRALLSSCYWPWMFKTGGFRFFVKFCERFGIPFPVGKHPVGTPETSIAKLEEALQTFIESSYAVLEDGGSIELLESKGAGGGGKLAQHLLIETCNAEMSKALTSQTLSSDQPGNGSRAASQTHRQRTVDVMEGDREQLGYTLDALWANITRLNFGEDVAPPHSSFADEEEVTKDRAEVFQIFTQLGGQPSRKSMAEELGITLADESDPADALKPAPPPVPSGLAGDAGIGVSGTPPAASQFAAPSGLAAAFPDQVALDAALDALDQQDVTPQLLPLLQPLIALAKRDPTAVLGQLADAYPDMDADALTDWLMRLLFVADTWGRLAAQQEAGGADNPKP